MFFLLKRTYNILLRVSAWMDQNIHIYLWRWSSVHCSAFAFRRGTTTGSTFSFLPYVSSWLSLGPRFFRSSSTFFVLYFICCLSLYSFRVVSVWFFAFVSGEVCELSLRHKTKAFSIVLYCTYCCVRAVDGYYILLWEPLMLIWTVIDNVNLDHYC